MSKIEKISVKLKEVRNLQKEFGCGIAYRCFMAMAFHKDNFIGRYFVQKKKKVVKDCIYDASVDVQKQYKMKINKECKIQNNDRIWIFWWQGIQNAPEIVKLCIDSVKKNLGNHELIIITEDNLNKYIQLPDYIYKKYQENKMCTANFADVIRVALLAEYGGIWLDATILMSEPFKKEFYNSIFCSNKRKEQSTSLLYPAQCRWGTYFLAAGKNNIVFEYVRDVFYEYWKKYDMCIDYGMIDFIIDLGYDLNTQIRKTIDEAPYYGEKIHYLLPILNDKFDENKYKYILESNNIHKLSHKIKFVEKVDSEKTFYGVIKKQVNNI